MVYKFPLWYIKKINKGHTLHTEVDPLFIFVSKKNRRFWDYFDHITTCFMSEVIYEELKFIIIKLIIIQ